MSTSDLSVLVVGATGGIGRAVLEVLESRGVPAVGTYRGELPKNADGRTWVRFDALEREGSKDLQRTFGKPARGLCAMVYCIAVPSSKHSIVETHEDEWLKLFAVNVASFARAYTSVAPALRAAHARVVVFSSDATQTVAPRNGPYTASKVALEALCQTLAKEEAPFGVHISVLAPTLVDSPLADYILRLKGVSNRQKYVNNLPWGRMLTLSEVAKAAVSLALDPQWEYTSGQIFRLSTVSQY